MMTLRDTIHLQVSQAIQGTVEFPQKGIDAYYQNRHNWVQLATDNIMKAFVQSIPEAVDVAKKYELHPEKGLHIKITEDDEHNDAMMEYLSNFSHDNGWNEYRYEVISSIQNSYRLQDKKESASMKVIGDNNVQ